jgi:hypothetical protein
MRCPSTLFASVVLAAAALPSRAGAQVQPPAPTRTTGTLAVQTVGLALASFSPTVGGGLSLARGDPWTTGQYITAYGFGAADLGFGIYGTTQWSDADRFEKTFSGISIAAGISNLTLAIYATARREPTSRPQAPVGDLVTSYLLGVGTLATGISELADAAGDSRLGAAAALIGAMNLGLAIYQTMQLSRPDPRMVRLLPFAAPDAHGRLVAGIAVRAAGF